MANLNVLARAKSQLTATLPSFVIENHTKFVNFLRAYYSWSAYEGPDLAFESIKLANDIDMVLEDMLPIYQRSYAKNLPTELKSDFRHFAKFLKEFYQLRGTPESYNIFFKAVFNEEASIHYPKVQIFKPSESSWNKETYLKVQTLNGDPYDLINTEVTGLINGYKAIVSNVVKVGDRYDVYIEDSTGDFEPDEIISSGNITATIVPLFKVLSFTSQPSWYDNSVIYTNDITLKVDRIHYGKIMSVSIVSGGSGYQVDDKIEAITEHQGTGFSAKVASVNGSGAITGITVTRSGFGFNNENVDLQVISVNGVNADLNPVFDSNFRKIKSLSILNNKEFTNVGDLTVNLIDGTQIIFTEGVTNTIKYWVNSQSNPSSDHSKIHDSDFYQQYSYEIQTRANAQSQIDSLKALLHIAGLKMFVKTILEDEVSINSDTSLIFT